MISFLLVPDRTADAKSAGRVWGGMDSNHRPADYESAALTN